MLGDYDDTPEGEVRKDMEATFSKWEQAKRVERIKRGKMGKAEKGLFVAGAPPYGYIVDKNAPGGLRVCEEQAEVVRRIFSFAVADYDSVIDQPARDDVKSASLYHQIAADLVHRVWNKQSHKGVSIADIQTEQAARLERCGHILQDREVLLIAKVTERDKHHQDNVEFSSKGDLAHVLLDIVEGLPQGKALDILESAPMAGFNSHIIGTNRYEETADSAVVVVTSGIGRKPGMTRDELLQTNRNIVVEVIRETVNKSPDCIIIMVIAWRQES